MKKTDLLLGSLSLFCALSSSSQTFIGKDAESKIKDAQQIEYSENLSKPTFIEFKASPSNFRMAVSNPLEAMKEILSLKSTDNLVSYKKEQDDIGFTHIRYQQVYKNVPVEGATYIAHQKAGLLDCINGVFVNIGDVSVSPALTESAALSKAMAFVGAKSYKWENKEEIAQLRELLKNPNFNYDPTGALVIYPKNGDLTDKGNFRLAYKFNIYAAEPESRANIFVDAISGEIIGRQELIHSADATGTANTKYSGTQTIKTTKLGNGTYVLRETERNSGGIATYNAKKAYWNSTLPKNDFIDDDNTWNNVNVDLDEAATDAHWATEMTWDYFKTTHSRDSYDNQGSALLNYVHCTDKDATTGAVIPWFNANWNGQFMRYGDGPSKLPLTCIDIGAHEMTHGVTGNSAQLVYQGESGALNESFSDIFGTCVEWFAKPTKADWRMGSDIGAIRDMQYPKAFTNPDTYNGVYWASTTDNSTTGDNGGVHTNSGVQNHWFFILTVGEQGVNDNSIPYTVKGIGMDKAAKIAYRTLTNYLTSTATYASARTNSLKSATDLYGSCSPEYLSTAYAWDAVGVTGTISCSVAPTAGFNAANTKPCDGTVQFKDLSAGTPTSWAWDFGDGQTATTQNPSHTYTADGTYTVKLTATNANGNTSDTKTSYVTIELPTGPATTSAARCGPGVINLSASTTGNSTLKWYTASTGGSSINTGTTYGPNLTNTTTYYVENQLDTTSQKLGATDSASLARGGYFTANYVHGLFFDVIAPLRLKSVKVYAGSAGIRVFDVVDLHGELVLTKKVNVPKGESRVILNFDLFEGTQYFLKISGTLLDFQRAKGGASYPYTIAGLISITETDVKATAPNSYYFFYDWEVMKSGCPAPRTPVTGTINPDVPKPTITEAAKVLSAPAGSGYTYQWYKDGQLISGATNQTYKPTQDGSYTVKVTGVGSCSATSDGYPFIANGIKTNALDAAVRIYPNPASEAIYVEAPLNGNNVININVYSVIGKLIYQESYTNNGQAHQVNMSGIAADGIYFIKLQSGTETTTRKITLSH